MATNTNATIQFVNPYDTGIGIFGKGSVMDPIRSYIIFGGTIILALVALGFIATIFLIQPLFEMAIGENIFSSVIPYTIIALVVLAIVQQIFEGGGSKIEIKPGHVGVPMIFGKPTKLFLLSSGNHWTPKKIITAKAIPISVQLQDMKISGMLSSDGVPMFVDLGFFSMITDPYTYMNNLEVTPELLKNALTAFADSGTRDEILIRDWRTSALGQGKAELKNDLEKSIMEAMQKDADDVDGDDWVNFNIFGFQSKLRLIKEILPVDAKLLEEVSAKPKEEAQRKAQETEAETLMLIVSRYMQGVKDDTGKYIVPRMDYEKALAQAQRTLGQRPGEVFMNISGGSDSIQVLAAALSKK